MKTFIKQLGGPTVVAKVCGLKSPADVTNWYQRGIGYRQRKDVETLAKSLKVKLPPDFWTAKIPETFNND